MAAHIFKEADRGREQELIQLAQAVSGPAPAAAAAARGPIAAVRASAGPQGCTRGAPACAHPARAARAPRPGCSAAAWRRTAPCCSRKPFRSEWRRAALQLRANMRRRPIRAHCLPPGPRPPPALDWQAPQCPRRLTCLPACRRLRTLPQGLPGVLWLALHSNRPARAGRHRSHAGAPPAPAPAPATTQQPCRHRATPGPAALPPRLPGLGCRRAAGAGLAGEPRAAAPA